MAQPQNWQPYPYPPQPQESKVGPALGVAGGGCAVLVGLLVIVAFFLPWVQSPFGGEINGLDSLKDTLDAFDNTASQVLVALLNSSPVLAGLGSAVFGVGLAIGAFAARRGGALRAWMATSIGGMVVLGTFLPCSLLSQALETNSTDQFELGFWLVLGGALFLIVPAFIGLTSAFLARGE